MRTQCDTHANQENTNTNREEMLPWQCQRQSVLQEAEMVEFGNTPGMPSTACMPVWVFPLESRITHNHNDMANVQMYCATGCIEALGDRETE